MPNKGKKRLVCDLCGATYFKSLLFKIHQDTHELDDQEVITCSTCNQQFVGETAYYHHMKLKQHANKQRNLESTSMESTFQDVDLVGKFLCFY